MTEERAPRAAEPAPADGLEDAAARLFEEQVASWPLLAAGIAGLGQCRTRVLRLASSTLVLRHVPHRLQSTTARVDSRSIQARPCFLCLPSLPKEQRGLALGEDWVALCNPFPILDRHLTIVHRRHVPQRLAGRIESLLAFARALPRSFVIYNGPECGASAPDHLHFQACDRSLLPVAEAARVGEGPLLLDYPSRPLVLRGEEPAGLARRIERAIEELGAGSEPAREPLVNLAASWAEGGFTSYLFARRKHRPEAFHAGELLLSPAAIDLCGVLVAPRREDFESLTAERASAVFDEVMLGRSELSALIERMAGRT